VFRKVISVLAILLPLGALSFLTLPAMPAAQQPESHSRIEQEMEDRRFHEANKRRQDEIREDTQKLFQLASDLKAAVDKTNENTMSLEVIRKAEEVEKLARKVKDKMREGTAKAPKPILLPPPAPHLPN
jgi:hypothetical protein